jgi:hypothetical protein
MICGNDDSTSFLFADFPQAEHQLDNYNLFSAKKGSGKITHESVPFINPLGSGTSPSQSAHPT